MLRRMVIAAALVGLTTPVVQAQNVPATPPAPADEAPAPLTFNAFVSASYHHNFNDPPSGLNSLRVFDVNESTFTIDVFELVVQKAVSEPGDVGFRADLEAGASIPHLSASRGLFRNTETGQAEDVDLQQAMVSWIAPVGRGLRLDVGKHVTHMGYEVIEGYDGWNDHATRSILFGYAIPFTHTGLKASYAFSDKVSATGYLVNGWDNVVDNNDGKTFGAQLLLTPSSKVQVYVNGIAGPERDGDDDGARKVLDLIAVFKPTDRLTFAANADFGSETDALGSGEDASWTGFAGYAKLQLGDNGAIALRAERFDDDESVRTGTAQALTEFTITPEWRITDKAVFRADLRFDSSDEDVFEDDDGDAKDSQATVSFNLLFSF